MIINEKELILDIKEMFETYNSDREFTEAELNDLVDEVIDQVIEAMYQASSDVVVDFSNRWLN